MTDIRRLTGLSLLLISAATAGTVSAADDRTEAARACAAALAEGQDAQSYEVVRSESRTGRRNYRFWMNASDVEASGYCEFDDGAVVRLVTRELAWGDRQIEPASTNRAAVGPLASR